MAQQTPLVIIDGQVQRLPAGDTISGAGGGSAETDKLIKTVNKTAHGYAPGKLLTFVGTWQLYLGGNLVNGIVTEVIDVNNFKVQIKGFIDTSTILPTLSDWTYYYADSCNPGDLKKPQDLVDIDRLNFVRGEPAILYHYSDGNSIILASEALAETVTFHEASIDHLTDHCTLWYYDLGGTGEYQLASAASVDTLSTHISVARGIEGYSLGLLIPTANLENTSVPEDFSYSISNPLQRIAFTGAEDGTKVYLSVTPGEVTITPPAIKQVVGVISYEVVSWCTPYREYPQITVSASAPSTPSVGDLWVDIS